MYVRLITNPFLRTIVRRTGLVRLVKLLFQGASQYERVFSEAMLAAVQRGDCVWDVGANVGYYTCKFAALVGNVGTVHAFEPFRQTFSELEEAVRVAACTTVRLHHVALGREDSEVSASASTKDGGVTNSLVGAAKPDGEVEQVRVVRGDSLVARGVGVPNVLKIDVEAYEEEVIDGLGATLRRPEVRAVFCEVHFGQLAARGQPDAPRRIERKLRDAGFTVNWADPSHIVATKRSS